MYKDQPTKKDRRDRRDAWFIREADPMHVMLPYMMPGRCNNEAVVSDTVDITALKAYIDKKNADNPEFKYTWFHAISAAIAKTILLRPCMNRFYSGHRLYERKNIQLSFIVRRKFEDRSQEAVAMFKLRKDGESPIKQFHDYVDKFVNKVRVKNEQDGSNDQLSNFSKMPRWVLLIAFWIMRRLESVGLYPKFLMDIDPTYSSCYISNLGSIKMKANYHHIYDWGTLSFFVVINEMKKRPIFNEDGTFEMRDTIDLGYTVDERIADGYYFAKSLKIVKHLLENPELLDEPANTPVEI